MTSIVTAVFEATVGLLVRKGRDVAAEKLNAGDITDQQFRNLIVREITDIKSKLDGLARKDLLASLSFFKEGLVFLYQLFDQTISGELGTATARTEQENLAVSLKSSTDNLKLSVDAVSFAEELKAVNLTDLDESAKRGLFNAKKRFDDARREATRAFSNESLSRSDRILAMKIRIMAILLHEVDNPACALAACRVCLEELHAIPAVQKSFNVEVSQGFKSLFNKDERGELITAVCHVNRVIYSVTQIVGKGGGELFIWPSVNIGKENVDPLRDQRVARRLRELNMEHCCIVSSFGQEGEEVHKLKRPWNIATNTQSQFIVIADGKVNVFDNTGKFLYSLCPPLDVGDCCEELWDLLWKLILLIFCPLYALYLCYVEDKEEPRRPWGGRSPLSVATDRKGNVYVLAYTLVNSGCTAGWQSVYVFGQLAEVRWQFPLRQGSCGRSVTVSDRYQVFVAVFRDNGNHVEVYTTDGRFVRSFGVEILGYEIEITAANDGHVMVFGVNSQCVHVFSAQGDHLRQFTVHGGHMAFHQASEHVIMSSLNPDNGNRGQVSIYTKGGAFLGSIQLGTEKESSLAGVTVTVDGRIAVTSYEEGKVYVV